MPRALTLPEPVSLAEFDRLFEAVKNWGRWGPDDELGTLNYLTPEKRAAAARLVRSGRTVSMAIPINKVAGPDNPNPAYHFISLNHDIPISASGLTFGMCFLGMVSHGDCHTHIDALNHVGYRGELYNGKPVATLTSKGSDWGSIAAYADGIVGRGVLLDAARHRGVDWLEPGEAVNRAELEAIEEAEGVRLGEGDILVFRTGPPRPTARAGSLEQRLPAGRRGQGRPARRHHPLDARAEDRGIPPGRRRGDGPEQRRGDALPDPPAPADRDGDVHLRQPPARGAGGRLRGGGALGVHGRRAPAAASRRHRVAVEPDRDLLGRPHGGRPSTTPGPGPVHRRKDRQMEKAGRVAIVTGGGTGIGAATALELARQGVAVALVGRRPEELERTADAITEAGGAAMAIPADMADIGAPRAIVDAVVAAWGRIDVIINNAATIRTGPFEDVTPEVFDTHVAVNVRGPYFLVQAALPWLRKSDAPAVVYVSSSSGSLFIPGQSIYGMTKAAIEYHTGSLAAELAPFGIRVNCVAPGPVDTPIHLTLGRRRRGRRLPAHERRAPPRAGWGRPTSWATGWRPSPAHRPTWITGNVWHVDGGQVLPGANSKISAD